MVVVTASLQNEAVGHANSRVAWLSQEQLAFAEPASITNPPMVLIAAAGSGKTECLVARFEWCMRHCEIGDTLQILSFSNSASRAFQTRFESRWGVQAFCVAKTLHSWVKHHILMPHVGSEHRVSVIIERALKLLRGPNASTVANAFIGLHLLVDEAQDCDDSQWELLSLLRDMGARVAAVGDPRQAIYCFQGARADGIMTLHEPALHARLVTNRRSTKVIVDLANVIATATLPQCPYTGLEAEREHVQKVPTGASIGERVSIHYVPSLTHYGIKSVWLCIMAAPRAHPVCVLTWANSDAIRLHHSIWLLGYETVVIVSQEETSPGDALAPDNLRSDSDSFNLIHVRTVHSAKGEGYETVVFHIRGYASQDDAVRDFEQRNKIEQQEELRRYYVACTRAKNKLHVIIQGPVAPLWWSAIAKNSTTLLVTEHSFRGPKPTQGASSLGALPAAKNMEVKQLRCRYSATDSLLTHSSRSHRRMQSIHCSGECVQSILADSVEPLEEASQPPSIPMALVWLQAESLAGVMRKYILYFVFAPNFARLRVARALEDVAKIPLDVASLTSIDAWEGLNDAALLATLASALGKYVESPGQANFRQLVDVLDSISRKVSSLSVKMPPFALTTGSVFQEYAGVSDADATFHVGEIGSATRKHAANRLLQYSSRPEDINVTSLFRRRTVFDSKYLSACRNSLVDACTGLMKTSVNSPSLVAASGLLCEFLASDKNNMGVGDVARVLPYLGNSQSSVARISLEEDCIGRQDMLDAALSQATALRLRILDWHSQNELDHCEVELRPQNRVEDTPCILQGAIPIFVPSFAYPERCSTSIFLVGRLRVCVEDEAEALVSAALLSEGRAHRVVLLEESTARCYIFNVQPDEQADWAATRVWAEEKLAAACV